MSAEKRLDPLWIEHGYGTRFQGFQNLMRHRIRDVLLVSSLYDLYLFEEDGRFDELISNEYQTLNLSHSPELTRVSSGKEAIILAKEERRFDLILTTLHVEDMTAVRLAQLARQAGVQIPIVLLAYDSKELKDLKAHNYTAAFDRVFVWNGDFRLIVAIIKHLEDRMNVDHDTRLVGIQSIIFIEDNIQHCSTLLPILYTELLTQSQRLISEGINLSHKFLRTVARPKILVCQTYEEAWQYFETYKEHILGIISDIDFPREGRPDYGAGIKFAKAARSIYPEMPIMLQSLTSDYEAEAKALNLSFVPKDSPKLALLLRQFMTEYFSFGDFVFRTPDGHEVGRASDLKSLREQLAYVPEESIRYHAERNHFSNWLKARTEFALAHLVRPRKVSDFPTVEGLRNDLISSLGAYTRFQQRGLITDFEKDKFDPETSLARIGGGSLGGKARGLGFLNTLINNYGVRRLFDGVQIAVPPAVVLGTHLFDRFLDENNLRQFALESTDDLEITKRFLEANFPEDVLGDLASFLHEIRVPLAVRSSSMLEDSQYHPFAGVYQTYMIPNDHPDQFVRLGQLVTTIKRVYASTFYQCAKDYFRVTDYSLEEEKMAVIVQKMVGAKHESRFYPDFSGVAKSYNFYPVPPQKPLDGIVSVALGLGKTIVEGGVTVRFCPKYPNHLLQFFSTSEAILNNQNQFFALDLTARPTEEAETHDTLVRSFGLADAEADGTLRSLASTYSPENDALYDGMSRTGLRVVSFAPILRNKVFPLARIIELLMDMGSWGMGTPVEMEFAVSLSVRSGQPKEFALLQLRPLGLSKESDPLQIEDIAKEKLICRSTQVLGHGMTSDIYDIVFVDVERFQRAKSLDAAYEVMYFNESLVAQHRPYLLIGVGRWGSLDPWLGIPVKWDQISGAKVIVEAGFRDMEVDPSQGSHFFHNITSFRISYFTVNSTTQDGFIDWEWLRTNPVVEERQFVRHIRLEHPVVAKVDGHQNKGIILKPEQGFGR
ncbi:MAG: histidine kinase [Acidobacteria bacterium]|nr:histidine kinase [Acidobacteriota bacterium]